VPSSDELLHLPKQQPSRQHEHSFLLSPQDGGMPLPLKNNTF
jgi:hypothetical protein